MKSLMYEKDIKGVLNMQIVIPYADAISDIPKHPIKQRII